MSNSIDAVIAALGTELKQAESSGATYVKSNRCNRWIGQLPGGWLRWRNLKIRGDIDGDVCRSEFITHVKSTIAYLDTLRDQSQTHMTLRQRLASALQRGRTSSTSKDDPIDAEYTDVPPTSGHRRLPKPKVVK